MARISIATTVDTTFNNIVTNIVTGIPEDKTKEAHHFITEGEKLGIWKSRKQAIEVRNNDYQIPEGSTITPYKKYLTQYASRLQEKIDNISEQKRQAESALASLQPSTQP